MFHHFPESHRYILRNLCHRFLDLLFTIFDLHRSAFFSIHAPTRKGNPFSSFREYRINYTHTGTYDDGVPADSVCFTALSSVFVYLLRFFALYKIIRRKNSIQSCRFHIKVIQVLIIFAYINYLQPSSFISVFTFSVSNINFLRYAIIIIHSVSDYFSLAVTFNKANNIQFFSLIIY